MKKFMLCAFLSTQIFAVESDDMDVSCPCPVIQARKKFETETGISWSVMINNDKTVSLFIRGLKAESFYAFYRPNTNEIIIKSKQAKIQEECAFKLWPCTTISDIVEFSVKNHEKKYFNENLFVNGKADIERIKSQPDKIVIFHKDTKTIELKAPYIPNPLTSQEDINKELATECPLEVQVN